MKRKNIRVPIKRIKNNALVLSVLGATAVSVYASKKLGLGLGTFLVLFAALWFGIFVLAFTFMLRSEIAKRS
ncbi:hypothetical protein [Paenibacillus sp. UNC496MF]|uniref:hypothetical protein n=1 Tax=Paenibacillus sp. UNC496MF TaxID=1502753 RepID=UPI000B82DC88|nr:hypothetical protein [Paenibacillus sp. UNC496MF]